MRRRHPAAGLGALVAALVAAASPTAADARADVAALETSTAPIAAVRPAKRRDVPFTALDAALIVGGGGGLIAVGAGLRRAARKKA